MPKIGLIAGNRKFPLLFAEAARRKGYSVTAVAVKGEACPRIRKIVDKVFWLGLPEFRRVSEIFSGEGIKEVAMAGQIAPRRLFSREVARDPYLQELFCCVRDKRADTIFGALVQRLEEGGLRLIDSTTFLSDYLPAKGILTRRGPNMQESGVLSFGLSLAKAVAGLDIGQSVAVKSKAIVAVEAIEGTDSLILRAGKLAGSGLTIVKVSKPRQDMRFDIPVIGLGTIKALLRAGASCLGIEAGKTLFIDREVSLSLADARGLVIAAL